MSNAEFDRHAAAYHETHARNIAWSGEAPEYFSDYKVRDFVGLLRRTEVSARGRFLDFGSGIGGVVGPFRRYLPDARLTCADVSAASLALSRSTHGDTVEHVLLSSERLPFRAWEFDGILACCVFHHIPVNVHERILRELLRVTKPGGILMIYEHNPLNPFTLHAVRTCPFDMDAVLLNAKRTRFAAVRAGWKHYRTSYRVFFPAALKMLRPLEDRLGWLPLGAQYYLALRA